MKVKYDVIYTIIKNNVHVDLRTFKIREVLEICTWLCWEYRAYGANRTFGSAIYN